MGEFLNFISKVLNFSFWLALISKSSLLFSDCRLQNHNLFLFHEHNIPIWFFRAIIYRSFIFLQILLLFTLSVFSVLLCFCYLVLFPALIAASFLQCLLVPGCPFMFNEGTPVGPADGSSVRKGGDGCAGRHWGMIEWCAGLCHPRLPTASFCWSFLWCR